MMWVILLLISILLLRAVCKWINCYATMLGLMYYLGDKYNDMMDGKKIRELRDYALQRRIQELTGRNTK